MDRIARLISEREKLNLVPTKRRGAQWKRITDHLDEEVRAEQRFNLAGLPEHQRSYMNKFFRISEDIYNKSQDRRNIARLRGTSSQRYKTLSAEISMLEKKRQRQYDRATKGLISVTCTFIFTVAFPDGKTKNIIVYASENTENYRTAIQDAEQQIIDDLLKYLRGYVANSEWKGPIGSLYHIMEGDDSHQRTLVPGPGGTLWQSVTTTHQKMIGPMRAGDLRVADEFARIIPGLTSFEGPYGCLVAAISHTTGDMDLRIVERFSEIRETKSILIKAEVDDKKVLQEEITPTENQEYGYTVRQFIHYVEKHMKKFYVVLHFPLMNSIHINKPPRDNHHYKRADFMIRESHIYGGRPPLSWKLPKQVQILKADEFDIDLYGDEPIAIYLKDTDLLEVATQIYKEKGIVPSIEFQDVGISAIKYNKAVIIDGVQYDERKACYEMMQARHKFDAKFRRPFANQTWSQLASNEMKASGVKIFKAKDNMYDRELYKQYVTGPFIGMNEQLPGSPDQLQAEGRLISIDACKMYVQVAIENEQTRVPIYSWTDSFKTVHPDNAETIAQMIDDGCLCEVIVDAFTAEGYPIPSQIFSGDYVKWLMNEGYIHPHHILYFKQCFRYDTLQNLSNHLKYLYQTYPKYFKHMYTRLIGGLGANEHRSTKGILTNDPQYYAAVRGQCRDTTDKVHNTNVDGLYIVKRVKVQQCLASYSPYFRAIANGSIKKLLQMAKFCRGLGAQILSSRVDNIVMVLDPKMKPQLDQFVKRKWGRSFDPEGIDSAVYQKVVVKNIIQSAASYIPHPPKLIEGGWQIEYDEQTFEIKTSQEHLEGLQYRKSPYGKYRFGFNTRYYADPGAGKTRQLAQLFEMICSGSTHDIKILLTCWQNKVRANLLKLKMEEDARKHNVKVEIHVKNFAQLQIMHAKGKLTTVYSFIFLDEYSCMGDNDWGMMQVLINQSPDCVLHVFGDDKQLHGVRKRWIDWNSNAVKFCIPQAELVDYVFEGDMKSRMDKEMYECVMELWNTGKLNEKLLSRVVQFTKGTYKRGVAKKNKMCKAVGRVMTHRGLKLDKPHYCIENNKKAGYWNGMEVSDKERELMKIPDAHILPSCCLTAYRAQGMTFEDGYVVYQAEMMTLNELFVAISRGRTLGQLVICGDVNKLRNHTWVAESEPTRIVTSVHTKRDVEDVSDETKEFRHLIYLISSYDKLGRPSYYVGKTEVNVKGVLDGYSLDQQDEIEMRERFDQHLKDNPKIPKNSDVDKLCVTYCVRDSVELAELEGEWIREYERLAEEMDGEILNVQLTEKANKKKKRAPKKVQEPAEDEDVVARIVMERSEYRPEDKLDMDGMNDLLRRADLGEITFAANTYKYLYRKETAEHKFKQQIQSKVMKAGERSALDKLWNKIVEWLEDEINEVIRMKALSAGLISL